MNTHEKLARKKAVELVNKWWKEANILSKTTMLKMASLEELDNRITTAILDAENRGRNSNKKLKNALSIAYNIIIRYVPSDSLNPNGMRIIENALDYSPSTRSTTKSRRKVG